jgi:hypothetical protein
MTSLNHRPKKSIGVANQIFQIDRLSKFSFHIAGLGLPAVFRHTGTISLMQAERAERK